MSYVNKKTRAFRRIEDVEEAERKRSDGRMKSYLSATDARAWCDITEDQRQYILELIRKGWGKPQYGGKLLSVEELIKYFLKLDEYKPPVKQDTKDWVEKTKFSEAENPPDDLFSNKKSSHKPPESIKEEPTDEEDVGNEKFNAGFIENQGTGEDNKAGFNPEEKVEAVSNYDDIGELRSGEELPKQCPPEAECHTKPDGTAQDCTMQCPIVKKSLSKLAEKQKMEQQCPPQAKCHKKPDGTIQDCPMDCPIVKKSSAKIPEKCPPQAKCHLKPDGTIQDCPKECPVSKKPSGKLDQIPPAVKPDGTTRDCPLECTMSKKPTAKLAEKSKFDQCPPETKCHLKPDGTKQDCSIECSVVKKSTVKSLQNETSSLEDESSTEEFTIVKKEPNLESSRPMSHTVQERKLSLTTFEHVCICAELLSSIKSYSSKSSMLKGVGKIKNNRGCAGDESKMAIKLIRQNTELTRRLQAEKQNTQEKISQLQHILDKLNRDLFMEKEKNDNLVSRYTNQLKTVENMQLEMDLERSRSLSEKRKMQKHNSNITQMLEANKLTCGSCCLKTTERVAVYKALPHIRAEVQVVGCSQQKREFYKCRCSPRNISKPFNFDK